MSTRTEDAPGAVPSGSLQQLFEFIFQRGKLVFRPGAAADDQPLKDAFKQLKSTLGSAPQLQAFPQVNPLESLHTGRYAASPWAALLDHRETDSIQHGVYVVYLFCMDMSGVYLCISQGVSELKGSSKAKREVLRQRSRDLAPRFESLRHQGLDLDHPIDLRSDKPLPEDYKAATVAHRFYAAGQVPPDAALFRDLTAVLTAYDLFVQVKLGLTPPEPARPVRVLRMTHAGDEASWAQWQDQGYAGSGIGRKMGTLRDYPDQETFVSNFLQRHLSDYHDLNALAEEAARDLWELTALSLGDRVVAMRGPTEVLGVGTVTTDGYTWRGTANPYPHTVGVEWDLRPARRLAEQYDWAAREIATIPPEHWEAVLTEGPGIVPVREMEAVQRSFSRTLSASRIHFGKEHDALVRSFLASLATKRLVILTGLSGSGKTQIALRLGQWFGAGRYRVIPVRPDWTGSEALFGYEDALKPVKDQQRGWYVPDALRFMLEAARNPNAPYLLVLDEMNLAHVERYFADFLSGAESGEPVLPNLFPDVQGENPDQHWRLATGRPERIPIPENLFVVGTVNVDETTYMFSPKVLDRANTFEFRVEPEDLSTAAARPTKATAGLAPLVAGFLSVAADANWHTAQPHPDAQLFFSRFRDVHRVLFAGGLEFGHRVFTEGARFAAMLSACGEPDWLEALDMQIMQKVLPRLHGSRRRLEPTLAALGHFCVDLTVDVKGPEMAEVTFDLLKQPDHPPKLRRSFIKIQRMAKALQQNHFAAFTE
jgi:hypothetical protein